MTDSTIYGVCGENTAMHTLSLITDAGDTLQFMLDDSETDPVVGGLLAGDRLAVMEGPEMDGEKTAKKVINMTTLMGKRTSLDKNFEIQEGGVVKSYVEAEKNPRPAGRLSTDDWYSTEIPSILTIWVAIPFIWKTTRVSSYTRGLNRRENGTVQCSRLGVWQRAAYLET